MRWSASLKKAVVYRGSVRIGPRHLENTGCEKMESVMSGIFDNYAQADDEFNEANAKRDSAIVALIKRIAEIMSMRPGAQQITSEHVHMESVKWDAEVEDYIIPFRIITGTYWEGLNQPIITLPAEIIDASVEGVLQYFSELEEAV